jgi:hypothetical protein
VKLGSDFARVKLLFRGGFHLSLGIRGRVLALGSSVQFGIVLVMGAGIVVGVIFIFAVACLALLPARLRMGWRALSAQAMGVLDTISIRGETKIQLTFFD